MTMTNTERAAQANDALMAYCLSKEGRERLYDVQEACIMDLICDLCHLLRRGCDRDDTMAVLTAAHGIFEAEVAEERAPWE